MIRVHWETHKHLILGLRGISKPTKSVGWCELASDSYTSLEVSDYSDILLEVLKVEFVLVGMIELEIMTD